MLKNRYISISQPRIVRMTKFGMQMQILTQAMDTWENFRNSQIQDSGRTPYSESFSGYNSAPYCPIKTKFGMRKNNCTHTKVSWWKRSKFRKSNMADGSHFENISISQLQIIRIWWNLVCNCKFWSRGRKRDKFTNSQIQGVGWTPHWKSLFGYNWAVYCPIKMKFGVRRQNHTHTKQVRRQKMTNYENPK